ncbi:Smr/MutS family protein [Roseibacterium sp. SDUM158017]|uniref:Smr/MutS family protein n=1 Tax=Roseicyclus salinarum TaxID=3036773 RepID=UPI00241560D3|nr:Smr/MutS family protein [Roseibacterium sp. SDUM158017]MDG4646952.1 Smr/MutS family protein [Roseibacterium sp. SDUM158017]
MARRRKGLSPEDRELWDRVKRSAKPLAPPSLERSMEKPQTPVRRPEPSRSPEPPDTLTIKPFRIGDTASVPTQAPERPPAHGPVRMQHKTHRRMVRGKLTPEARLDLHGMTIADAHPALVRFIAGAHDRGLRLVLVITGKGRAGEDVGPIPVRRGVLRQQVPGWLTAPPLGAMVLEIREAHQRHGGGGAYYVYLRRRR